MGRWPLESNDGDDGLSGRGGGRAQGVCRGGSRAQAGNGGRSAPGGGGMPPDAAAQMMGMMAGRDAGGMQHCMHPGMQGGAGVTGRGHASSAIFGLGAALFTAIATFNANASVIDEYLEKSKANKELNDKKRLATSGANFARAYTVQFGTCKFPENFTGCQDLAKQKKVPFISDDLALECEGKDKYKCGSNVFWKW
ncbi:photosystem I reaction center subunit N, chloroplastic-like [Salvia hispanica]|uniref:photosystem I reaction center subunit N, chloroplastic-like n=1 Tax=Salvia hispanica TaxID=49212 RepID=UPI002009D6BC|nr:photosystem I reaction center subunit N, chloroplastic-like [Salvia hispanica]